MTEARPAGYDPVDDADDGCPSIARMIDGRTVKTDCRDSLIYCLERFLASP